MRFLFHFCILKISQLQYFYAQNITQEINMNKSHYQNCFSLGWFCGIASSLVNLGLRGCSGPFDWCFTRYPQVLKLIENGFKDFMNPQNLQVVKDFPKQFKDLAYDFHCIHDIKEDFEKEKDDIIKKYKKRSVRFLEQITKPTLFFRGVWDNAEIDYINENYKKAEKIVKAYNSENKIVYITLKSQKTLCSDVCHFCVPVENYIGKTLEMRYFFHQSSELMDFCNTVLSCKVQMQNKAFDFASNSKEEQRTMFFTMLEKMPQQTYKFFTPLFAPYAQALGVGLYVFGAGKYGTIITNYLLSHKIAVRAVVDNAKTGTVNSIPIIKADNIANGSLVFVAILKASAKHEVSAQLCSLGKNACVIGIDDILAMHKFTYQKELLDWY